MYLLSPDDRPRIDYPCRWSYRIIGTSETAIRAAIAAGVGGTAHLVVPTHVSRTGRYVALKLTLIVRDEPHRLALYEHLCRQETVRYVL